MTLLLAGLLLLAAAAPGHAALYAAAGKADITPDPKKETVWLAGYGASGRKATGVHDPLYARAVVVSDGKVTAAIASVDAIGLYREDVLDLRRALGWEGKSDRLLFMTATHDHSAPDTVGLWGRFPGVSGVDKKRHKRLKKSIVVLIKELEGRLQEAELSAARTEVDPEGLCRDSRDPVVMDPELNVLGLRTKGGAPLAAVVRWSCHPEVLQPDNTLITADFPGALCAKVEAERGGTCLFLPGLLGGLMTPDADASGPLEADYKEMERVGATLAGHALKALAAPGLRTRNAAVSFSSATALVPIENSRYLFFLPSLDFGHRLLDAEGRPLARWKRWYLPLRHLLLFPLPERLRPWVETEVTLLRVGPVKLLGIPGEVFPELVIGGYKGERRYGRPLVRPTNPNPPDLAKAPGPPYLRERLKAEHGIVVGLANDMLGYLVPEYDFKAAPTRTMTPKPPGTHYEETNSVGPRGSKIVLDAAAALLE
ncbi:MAG: neutral/alkaline non-lysosomal ceramidase N-terminal domain-containing protein [Elusimicrobia bacterium]|nr:neutral/alkaline non-lysosomal ceramidase N-terminal domain-containing protein [Elusimicrobiota bacterium]